MSAMAHDTALALEGCHIWRAPFDAGPVEIVAADARPRAFPMRVGDTLGICLKSGPAHAVRADGKLLSYPGDSVCIRPPGCVWSCEPSPTAFVSIDLPRACLPEEAQFGGMTFVPRHALPDVAHAAHIVRHATSALEAGQVLSDLVVAAIRIGALSSPVLRDDGPALRGAHRAREFLTAHAHENPTLDEVARQAGMNRFVLLRWFRRAFGVTPHAYLMAVRVDRARTMLAGGMRSAEAGVAAGFADQAHFTRQFKRFTGLTPSAYARLSARDRRGVR